MTVEGTTTTPLVLTFAVCIDGENACPPEDVRGIGGYQRFRVVLADPTDEEHEHFTQVGGVFDADISIWPL